jgi:hypothetical protein
LDNGPGTLSKPVVERGIGIAQSASHGFARPAHPVSDDGVSIVLLIPR